MFARYFLGILGVICLVWIGYVSADLVDKKDTYSPFTLFGLEDKNLLIVNRISEVDFDRIPFKMAAKTNELLGALQPHIDDNYSLVISAERRHFLVISPNNWTLGKVKKLFKKAHLGLSSKGINTLKVNGALVEFYKHYLYIHTEDYETTTINGWEKYDKRASAALINFIDNEVVVKDIYFKENGKIEFNTFNGQRIKGKQVNDRVLFAEILPRSIQNYHFTEKTYAASIDSIFESGPMHGWMETGYVECIYKGQTVLLSDFNPGQQPINVLGEEAKQEVESEKINLFKNIRLTQHFPTKPSNGFYALVCNDFVVLSEDQSACEALVANYKLENTLATDAVASKQIFDDLPRLVSERMVTKKEKYCKSVYKNKILETRISQKSQEQGSDQHNENEPFVMHIDASIQDFTVFDGKGNAAILTATGELMYYENGRNTWIKNLGSKPVGEIIYLEQFQFLLVTCQNALHLFDRAGNYVIGAPLAVGSYRPAKSATAFEWRKKLYLTFPDQSGNIVVYDSKRRFQFAAPTGGGGSVTEPVQAWTSQGKLFLGCRIDKNYHVVDVDKRKAIRSIPTGAQAVSTVNGKELIIFSQEGGGCMKIDQQGNKKALENTVYGNLKRSDLGMRESFVSIFGQGTLAVYDQAGIIVATLKTEAQNSEYVDVKSINGTTYIALVDGIENNVYVYSSLGSSRIGGTYEGSKKCTIHQKNGKTMLTTAVDDYLIQYVLEENN